MIVCAAMLCTISLSNAARLPVASPSRVGMSRQRLQAIDRAVAEAIERKELPGAVVLVGRHGRIVWRRAYGQRAVQPQPELMTVDTIFDVASLTKVVATTTSAMMLVERGQLRLADSVVKYLPELAGNGREQITVEQLLLHTSGYRPDFDLGEQWRGYDEALRRLFAERLNVAPGAQYTYSDIGMIALGEIIARVSGAGADEFARRQIFLPLGMRDTEFNPPPAKTSRIAPTETRRAQAAYLGGSGTATNETGNQFLRGEVHDPTAHRMQGVAGHAGLFSTADDLAVFCQMLLNGGRFSQRRILSPVGIAAMTRARAVRGDGAARALGWDVSSPNSGNRGDLFPPGSFGHTGFTGTSIWIDPASGAFVIFLSNRVHPEGKGNVTPLRGQIASIVAASITSIDERKLRDEATGHAADMLSTLAKIEFAQQSGARTANAQAAIDGTVLTGIDVLARDNFKPLQGLRIGLVTNHTGRDRRGQQTIDLLHQAPNVKLVALFAPEHGIRGTLDDKVSDSKDERTGLPVYSLYGESRRPNPEQLKNLDALVYDIQDIGVRFWTYSATLGNIMEEAAKARLPVFVLDRPNPIGGVEVEGPLADADQLSFTAYHTIPVRHGMTFGELAGLFNQERNINCDLRVIRMENWRREMWYDATNMLWTNPSPNMRSLTEATLYPGIGLLETTNVSVGRGTDTPFEVMGAPWIDGQRLSAYLNSRRIEGARFVPLKFTPHASVFKGEECGGVNIIITDRGAFKPVTVGFEIAAALRLLYPQEWKVDAYARLLANKETLALLKAGASPAEMTRAWQSSLSKFREARAKALLY